MKNKKILFIGGSLNQTTIAHAVAKNLESNHECFFTPYYCHGILKQLSKYGLTEFTSLGGTMKSMTMEYLLDNNLSIDFEGQKNDYDLVVTMSDLVIQKNIKKKKIVLVQEGMTDPENFMYYLVKSLKLPRYLASTSTTGLSNAYNAFCVASEGYKELFAKKGVRREKMVVTGLPNFDNVAQHFDNDFPHKNYVMVATSDARETLKYDNRKKFLQWVIDIAQERQLLFKLHPNEKIERATREIKSVAPDALIFSSGNTNHMVANCDVLITQYSSVVYIGLALGKEVHSYFKLEDLQKLTPIQNGGSSSQKIAKVCIKVMDAKNRVKPRYRTLGLDKIKWSGTRLKEIYEDRYGYTS